MLADCPAVCVCVSFCVSLGTMYNERGLIAGCAVCGVPREQNEASACWKHEELGHHRLQYSYMLHMQSGGLCAPTEAIIVLLEY